MEFELAFACGTRRTQVTATNGLLKTAIYFWGHGLIYWDGRGYRWSRAHSKCLPLGAVKGRIAVPYNKALKGIGPEQLHQLWKTGVAKC